METKKSHCREARTDYLEAKLDSAEIREDLLSANIKTSSNDREREAIAEIHIMLNKT